MKLYKNFAVYVSPNWIKLLNIQLKTELRAETKIWPTGQTELINAMKFRRITCQNAQKVCNFLLLATSEAITILMRPPKSRTVTDHITRIVLTSFVL